MAEPAYKIPVSVLVLVHTRALDVLLIERADRPGYWQSITGSQDPGETLVETAVRELREETGLHAAPESLIDWQLRNEYEIYPHWRHRYAPGVTRNVEHVFAVELPEKRPVTLSPREHLQHEWLFWRDAAARVFSSSNADAIRRLPARVDAGGSAEPRNEVP